MANEMAGQAMAQPPVTATPAGGAPAQPAMAGQPGAVPKKKAGIGKWIAIGVLALVVIGLLIYVFTALF